MCSLLCHLLTFSACVCACCMCSYGVCGPVWRPEVTAGSHRFGYTGWPRSSRNSSVFPKPPALDSNAGIPGAPRFSGGLGINPDSSLHTNHSRRFTHETVCSLFLGRLNQGSCTNWPFQGLSPDFRPTYTCGCLPRKGKPLQVWPHFPQKGLEFSWFPM